MGRSRIYALGLKGREEVSASSRFPLLPLGLDFLGFGGIPSARFNASSRRLAASSSVRASWSLSLSAIERYHA